MKKPFKQLVALLIPLLVLGGTVVNAAEEEEFDAFVGDSLSLGRCIAKGNIDFGVFLRSSIFVDGLAEGLYEPWVDVLARNQCQSGDVLSLMKQRDKIKKIIRESFLTCNNQNIPALRAAFYKISAEIYYVRHVVDGTIVASLPYGLNTRLLEDEKALFTDHSVLEANIREKYMGTDYIPEADFGNFMKLMQVKYKNRSKSYVVCESSDWDVVQEKWEEFIDSSAGVAPAWEDLEKSVSNRAAKIEQAASSYKDFFSGLVTLNVNNLAPSDAFEEILSEYKNIVGDDGVEIEVAISQKDFLNAFTRAEKRQDLDGKRQQFVARYEALYKNTGNDAIKNFVEGLEQFDATLKASLKPIGAVEQCSDTVNARQCPGQ
ncbi:hypothetical protein JKY72_04930 [Candidatus Gracilibacteria bacterium]|nr:hypothetical protein [Candidatus Gracilibacteria bacterium]